MNSNSNLLVHGESLPLREYRDYFGEVRGSISQEQLVRLAKESNIDFVVNRIGGNAKVKVEAIRA